MSITRKEGPFPTGFESLSSELLITIIKQLPELISLDSLIRASPSAFRVFNSYGTELMDSIISSENIHGHVRAMIRISALIRSSNLPMNNLHDFQHKTTISAMEQRICSFRTKLSPLQLEKNTSPVILRSILASNRHITNLSHELLETYLKRFQARRPRQLNIDTPTGFLALDEFLELVKDHWEEYSVHDTGPPTCDEEHRVIRAFWRIQTYHDMKKAATRNLLLGWSAKDISALDEMSLSCFYGTEDSVYGHYYYEPHPEHHELTSIAVHLRDAYGLEDITDIVNSCCLTPPYPPIETNREWPLIPLGRNQNEPWTRGVGMYIIRSSVGCSFYHHHFQIRLKERLPFELFGKLGFAFWSAARMRAHGLLPRVLGSSPEEGCTAKWCSMLDEESLHKAAQLCVGKARVEPKVKLLDIPPEDWLADTFFLGEVALGITQSVWEMFIQLTGVLEND